jgi:hypothetical protein
MRKAARITAIAGLLLVELQLFLHAQTTAFTYQGRLDDNGAPATGTYDLIFQVIDAPSPQAGTVVGAAMFVNGVGITNGLFTVTLDFGAGLFNGADRWLEITVRTKGASQYFTLSPRQPITSALYAIRAAAVNPAGITGTFSGAMDFNNSANSFTGNGSGLSGDGSDIGAVEVIPPAPVQPRPVAPLIVDSLEIKPQMNTP